MSTEEAVSAQKALILGLGRFAQTQLFTDAQQTTITAELLRLYEQAPIRVS